MTDSPASTSVIIPTFNGEKRILNVLDALNDQTHLDFEVVVAIDGSSDDTEDLVTGFEFNFEGLRIVRQLNKGRASIRNFGARHASGELLIFYDDDMRPSIDSVEKHIQFYRQNSNAICSGNQLEEFAVMQTDIQRYKAHLSRKWTKKYNVGLSKLDDKNLFLTAANMTVPTRLFDQLGGFNELLTDAEDYEFAVRAFENGVDIYFDKSNIAWHDDLITLEGYILRQRQYNQARKKLKNYLPDQYLGQFEHMDSISMIKRITYSIFTKHGVLRQINKEWFKRLPQKLRYKIYDMTIYSLGHIFQAKKI